MNKPTLFFSLLFGLVAMLTQAGCPFGSEVKAPSGALPQAAVAPVLAQAAAPEQPADKPQAAASAAAAAEPKKEEPKPADDSNPVKGQRPKADRTPRKPGEAIRITFDNIILGMQADIPFRPWMLNDDVKELEGQRVSITGVMHGILEKPKGLKNFVLLRNSQCKYGPGGQADHLALVEMKPGQTIDYTVETVRVEGKLKISPETGKDGNTWSIYILEDATAKVQ